MWQRAAPLAVQLAHSRSVADDGTLAYAAIAYDRADCPTVARDLGVGRHARAVTQHHCPIRTERREKETNEQVELLQRTMRKNSTV